MNERKTNSEDHISLIGFRNIVISLLQTLFELQSFIFLAARRKIWYIIIGTLLGATLGWGYYKTRQAFYKASMIVTFNKLTKKTYAEIIDQLNQLATSGHTTKLAADLQIPQNVAKSILFFDAMNIYDVSLKSDTSQKIGQPFKIIIGIRDSINVDSFQKSLVTYLNNLPYLKTVSEVEKDLSTRRIEYIDRDLQKLDSLKTEFTRSLASGKNVSATFYNNAVNPAELYEQSTSLLARREQAQKIILYESETIAVIDNLQATKNPQSTSLIKALTVFTSVGLLLGFLIGLLRETREKVIVTKPTAS